MYSRRAVSFVAMVHLYLKTSSTNFFGPYLALGETTSEFLRTGSRLNRDDLRNFLRTGSRLNRDDLRNFLRTGRDSNPRPPP